LHWPVADRSQSRLVADLADRLAYVCASVLAVSLAQDPVAVADEFEVVTTPRAAAVDELDRSSRRARVVLIDEHGDADAGHVATSQTTQSQGREDRAAEPGRSQGTGGRGAAPRRAASSGAWSDPVPPIDRLDESRASGKASTRPRPLPWDTPPSADRAERAQRVDESASAAGEGRSTSEGEDAAGEGGSAADHPAIRVTRRTTPVDGAA
jgi:hypothetical protein